MAMNVLKGMTNKEMEAYVRDHIDPVVHARILSGTFTPQDMRTWRIATGLTQAKLGALLGYTYSRVAQVENDTIPASQAYLRSFRVLVVRAAAGLLHDQSHIQNSFSFVPRSTFTHHGWTLRFCANPHCHKEVYMSARQHYCSRRCRNYAINHGLIDDTRKTKPQGRSSYPATGPAVIVCPHCGRESPAKGNYHRPGAAKSHGGGADQPEG